jgi:hypothetical protein
MPIATAARAPQRASSAPTGLRCRIRLADGRTFTGELAPERHRLLQIGLLHQDTERLIEIAAGVRRDGRLQITTRRQADHFLPGGGIGENEWRHALLELAAATPTGARRCSSPPRRGPRHAAISTPCGRAGGCGSTSTSPASSTSCGRSWPIVPATFWWKAELSVAAVAGTDVRQRIERWRHVADRCSGLTRGAPGRHTTCTTCRPPVGAALCPDGSVREMWRLRWVT